MLNLIPGRSVWKIKKWENPYEKNKKESQIWLELLVAVICWAIIPAILLLVFKATGVMALIGIYTWTCMWLIFYTPHVGKMAIERYKEKIRKETLATPEDINDMVDPIIFKGAGGNRAHMHPFTKGGH